MKRLITVILVLAIVLFAASWGLRGLGAKTAQDQHLWLMQTLLPGSETFTLEPYSGEDGNIVCVHRAENGYLVETKTRGYADDMTMLVAVNFAGEVQGLVVLEAHETLGLGSKALPDHVLLSQFLNKTGAFTIGSAGADAFSGATAEGESAGEEVYVDGISGATVTSKAVARSVNSAVAFATGADAVSAATEWGG